MESRVKIAAEKHSAGYNCAQAVACTYCDLFGADEDVMFRALEGYGLGMGDMGSVCGALSGAIALAGLKNSKGVEDRVSKMGTYKLATEIKRKFAVMNGATVCRELKGVDSGQVLRSCPGCIEDACKIVESMLAE